MVDNSIGKRRRRWYPRKPSAPIGSAPSANSAGLERPQTSTGTAQVVPLKLIDVGEPDANAEYFLSQRSDKEPMYLRAYYEWDSGFSSDLANGSKFILYGQKGTGKTAILRHLEAASKKNTEQSLWCSAKRLLRKRSLRA